MDTKQHEEGDAHPGDLLVGADAIRAFLVHLGMPEGTDPTTSNAPVAGRSATPAAKAENSSPPNVASSATLKR